MFVHEAMSSSLNEKLIHYLLILTVKHSEGLFLCNVYIGLKGADVNIICSIIDGFFQRISPCTIYSKLFDSYFCYTKLHGVNMRLFYLGWGGSNFQNDII